MAAIPVIRHCNEVKSDLTILMTTTTVSALYVAHCCFLHKNLKLKKFKVFVFCNLVSLNLLVAVK